MKKNLPAEAYRQRWLVCNDEKVAVRHAEFNDALRMVQLGSTSATARARAVAETGALDGLSGEDTAQAVGSRYLFGGIDLIVTPANRVSKNLILLIDEAFGRIIQLDKHDETLTQWAKPCGR